MNRLYAELRADVTGGKLAGHAAVFGQYADLGTHLEELAPSAFDHVLAKDPDVRALINHDPNLLLARTRNGSLRLSTDSEGLVFEADLPSTTYAADLRELLDAGLLTQCSFGFIPGKVERSTTAGQRVVRHTSVAELFDVSPVTFPAYTGTDVALRALDLSGRRTTAREQLIRLRAANQRKQVS